MPTKKLQSHDDVLEALADAIDIPEHMDQRARDRYKSIGQWLDRKESSLVQLSPEISPQGSFLLGTVIRPIGDSEEYDIDVVCTVNMSKTDTTMVDLKRSVGIEIKSYTTAHNMNHAPEDGRRCWTLNYADDAQFHMDILPAIPDVERYRTLLNESRATNLLANQNIVEAAISITDKTLPQYSTISSDWPISNPKGFAVWFASRQADVLTARKRRLVEQAIYASVDDVPNYKVKTPLQRAIQLLKRHRNSMFGDDEHKPISVIITTLAAHVYNGEETIGAALRTILRNMGQFIEEREGTKWVQNPVNPHENFADKWSEVPEKEKNFFAWLSQAQRDFGTYLAGSYNAIPDQLQERMTDTTIKKVLPQLSSTSVSATTTAAVASEVDRVKDSGTETKPWGM